MAQTIRRIDFEQRSACLPESAYLLVGRDSHGNWIVRDRAKGQGRLFIDRAEALRFAMLENGSDPTAVVMSPTILEL